MSKIQKKSILSYPEVKSFLENNYKDSIPYLREFIVLEIPENLWEKFNFSGYGYLVKEQDVMSNYKYLKLAAENENYYNSLSKDQKRDVNVFKLWNRINKPPIFIIVRPDAEAYIVHEMSHLLFNRTTISPFQQFSFEDEYLDAPSEQFAHLNEMKFYQQKGISFDDYFKNTWPDEYNIISGYESGDKTYSIEKYNFAKMDERDFEKMWNYLENMKTSNSNKITITASARISKKTIKGKYGPFEAYVIEGDSPSDTYSIKEDLKRMGFQYYQGTWWISTKKLSEGNKSFLVKNLGVISQEDMPLSTSQPSQPAKPTQKQWITENEEMSKWYGFPINKSILSWEDEIEVAGQKHPVSITIDRTYKPGKDSSYYRETKSREHRGLPKYVYQITVPDIQVEDIKNKDQLKNLTMSFARISDKKWGTYDEEQFLEEFKKHIVDDVVKSPKSKFQKQVEFEDIINKRTPEYKQYLKDIEDKKVKPTYDFTIDDPVYGGKYKLGLYWLGMGERATDATLEPIIDTPNAPDKTLGYKEIDILNTVTIEDLNNTIKKYIVENKNEIQEELIKYLKSFPFLESQKEESRSDFERIKQYITGENTDADSVLRKIQEKGYIRPHKRQKQAPGLTMGEEIHWVIDSKKIVNDAYNMGSYMARTPDYFYTVVAYYIHRKVRGIWSWTDMMLMDAMKTWYDTMKELGAAFSFQDVEKVIENIGNIIVNKIYGKTTKEEKDKRFFEDFYGTSGGDKKDTSLGMLEELANFAKQYGIEVEGITKDNIKNIYRSLAKNLHPDLYQDPSKKEEMTEKFKELQQIWDRIPQEYKTALSWYDRFVVS